MSRSSSLERLPPPTPPAPAADHPRPSSRARRPASTREIRLVTLGLLSLLLMVAPGCTTVRFNERARLTDRTMVFDHDELEAEMVGHVLVPREASIGGFSPIGAGGCGCL